MFCQNCGEKKEQRRKCHHCGATYKRIQTPLIIAVFIAAVLSVVFLFFGTDLHMPTEQADVNEHASKKTIHIQEKGIPLTKGIEIEANQEVELTDVIARAQETVYTIYTTENQGSGFLYHENGAVVTNAHVVEGEVDVVVQTIKGEEFPGAVIGYSNETDVAVIQVPELAHKNPYAIEAEGQPQIGEEVIALGSPLGLENTATMGYITGKERSFFLDQYTYENILQISAPIASGSSGGPLISKESKKIVAINSAQSAVDESIGFSIPIFKVAGLIQRWIDQPMAEEDILAQFYDVNGDFFFDRLWADGRGYFGGGDYSEDDHDYHYDEYDYNDEYFWGDESEESDSWEEEEEEITEEEQQLYNQIQILNDEIEALESDLHQYPEYAEEYRELLEEQMELYEEMDELAEQLEAFQ